MNRSNIFYRKNSICLTLLIAFAWSFEPSLVCAQQLFDEASAITLFAFDDHSFPFIQNLKLTMRQPERHVGNPVLERGAPGSVDAMAVQFYGSIIRQGNLYRMWYVAQDDDEKNSVASSRWRPAYAESRDGITWTKPNLGLVEYHGSTQNNLVKVLPEPIGVVNLKVLFEPDEADPQRRYKMAAHVYFRHKTRLGTLATLVSADGLTWTMDMEAKPVHAELDKKDLIIEPFHFEPACGFYKWDGMYHLSAQNAMSAPSEYQGRIARGLRSSDFRKWSSATSISFARAVQHRYLGSGRSLEGEQNHEGIAVWDRRNVLLGIYGRWHGAKEWSDITVDLGFVISNDGIRFREPQHEWTFLECGQDGAWDQGGLLQGQGFENIGNKTHIYYGSWDPRARGVARGGMGLVTLPRDGFGYLSFDNRAEGDGDYQAPKVTAELISRSIPVAKMEGVNVYCNAEGLGEDSRLTIEVLDAIERPIAEYAMNNAANVATSGLQTPVIWPARQTIEGLDRDIKLRVRFEGKDRDRIKLNAIYLRPVETRR